MVKMELPFGTILVPQKAKDLINQALDDTRVSCGPLVRKFERKFAGLLGVEHAVAVSTGTDADALALALLHDLGAVHGDEVIIPALSFVATGNAVVHARLTPKFVDIQRDTLNIDVEQIESAITPRTKAIMPVHLMGKPAEMDTIMEVAKKYNLIVVEDAAEAHGMLYKGRPAGTIGDLGAFSLYVAHIITTIEGGVITCNNENYAEILISLRSHGRACSCSTCILSSTQIHCSKRFDEKTGEDLRFTFPRIGYSCKMNELEAAVGLGNMENYTNIVEKRYTNLKYVLDRFDKFSPYLSTIKEEEYEQIGPHAIPIIINEDASFTRAEFTHYIEENGIDTRTLFQSMPTQCPGFKSLGYEYGQFPVAEYMGHHGLHIGCHHDLEVEHMEYFLYHVEKFLTSHQK
ncbi:MAG: DegT/DnrJ/EryC1/StrS family aminotransferase [Desulfobacteraceae bacterium]|nr:DegT/DnrJ/EryC1/StrS family aminotransferase [Desulfobacteraceae bacterium]